jgi:flagellar biosynthetic protein FlhB
MNAPKVVAKGQDYLALHIKELANEYFIPIIANPPLARALYSSTEVDDVIPIEHYKAVAAVISYVMRIKGGKKFFTSKRNTRVEK